MFEIKRHNIHVISTFQNTRIDSFYNPSWWKIETNKQPYCKYWKMCPKTTSRKPMDNGQDDDEEGERRREHLRRENEM